MNGNVLIVDFAFACLRCGNRETFFASKSSQLWQYISRRDDEVRLRTVSDETELYVCRCGNTALREVEEEFLEGSGLTLRAFLKLPDETVVRLLS